MTLRIRFLGTGASGGTPGRGRSRRRESSVLLEDESSRVLIDVTRDAAEQLRGVESLDAVLLTHAHRDATGGIPQLHRWWSERDLPAVKVLGHGRTLTALTRRYRRLEHCDLTPVALRRPITCGTWTFRADEVAHAADPGVPTVAWRIGNDGRTLVYASDVARLGRSIERFARGADALVIDGATYGRTMFTHLRIDRDLPILCSWDVGDIWLTQIGRSAPPHRELSRIVRATCRRASPAYDGLVVEL